MGRIQRAYWLLLILFCIISCEKWDFTQEDFPTVFTTLLEKNGLTHASAEARITGLDLSRLKQTGHCWSSTNDFPKLTDTNTASFQTPIPGSLNFESDISNLLPTETYFLRAFAIYKSRGQLDTIYETSAQIFSTGQIEIATTNLIQNGLTATVFSFVKVPEGEYFTAFGHCWSSDNPNPTRDDAKQEYGALQQDSTFQSFISQLQPGRQYYVRAYVILNGQPYYSNALQFYTGDLWQQLTGLSDFLSRTKASYCTINHKFYMGLGVSFASFIVDTEHFKDWWCYDLDTDSWTQLADFIGHERASATTFSIGEKVYIGSGYVENYVFQSPGIFPPSIEYYTDFYAYDPTSNTWVRKKDFPVERSEAVSFVLSSKGYVGTGSRYTASNSVYNISIFSNFWAYDPYDDSAGLDVNGEPLGKWIPKAALPGPPRGGAIGFTIDTYGYVGAGRSGAPDACTPCVLKDFWQYDPNDLSNGLDVQGNPKGKWIRKADIGEYGRYGAYAFTLKSLGYIGGGSTKTVSNYDFPFLEPFKDLWQYDPDTDKWKQVSGIADGITYFFAPAFSTEDRGYVMDTHISGNRAIWEYIPQK